MQNKESLLQIQEIEKLKKELKEKDQAMKLMEEKLKVEEKATKTGAKWNRNEM